MDRYTSIATVIVICGGRNIREGMACSSVSRCSACGGMIGWGRCSGIITRSIPVGTEGGAGRSLHADADIMGRSLHAAADIMGRSLHADADIVGGTLSADAGMGRSWSTNVGMGGSWSANVDIVGWSSSTNLGIVGGSLRGPGVPTCALWVDPCMPMQGGSCSHTVCIWMRWHPGTQGLWLHPWCSMWPSSCSCSPLTAPSATMGWAWAPLQWLVGWLLLTSSKIVRQECCMCPI